MTPFAASPTVALALLIGGCGGAEDPEIVTETITVTNTVTNTVTDTVTNTIVETVTDGELEPGHFSPAISRIQTLQDNGGALGANGSGENHMHISDMYYRPASDTHQAMLMYCSYTFGVLDATNLDSMPFLAQGFRHLPITGTREPGCIHLIPDEDDPDIVYTTHHGNIDDGLSFLSGWDLGMYAKDPLKPTTMTLVPVQMPMLQETSTSYEGLDFEGGYLYVALHDEGVGVFQRDPATNVMTRVATYTDVTNAWDIQVAGTTAYVGDGLGGVLALDVSDPLDPSFLGRAVFDGQSKHIALNDDASVAFVAAESGGLVAVDIADPTNMTVLDTVTGAFAAIALDFDADKVYLAAWNDTRIYDVSDPTDIQFQAAWRETVQKNYSPADEGVRPDITDRVLGIAGLGDYVFSGTWWVPHNYRVHPGVLAPYIVLPEEINYIALPGQLAVGETSSTTIEVRNDGTADLTVYNVWTDNPSFTLTPGQLRVPPGGVGELTVNFTAALGYVSDDDTADTATPPSAEETALVYLYSDDPNQPVRTGWLVGNSDGAGVGDPLPETTMTLLDGTEWSYTNDAFGSVTLLAYFATF